MCVCVGKNKGTQVMLYLQNMSAVCATDTWNPDLNCYAKWFLGVFLIYVWLFFQVTSLKTYKKSESLQRQWSSEISIRTSLCHWVYVELSAMKDNWNEHLRGKVVCKFGGESVIGCCIEVIKI